MNDRYESEIKMERMEKLVSELKQKIYDLVLVQERHEKQIQNLEQSYNTLSEKIYQNRKEA
jgi:hypothetical protein